MHTEVASLDLARALGLTTIEAELIDFGGQLAIVVSRYDRAVDAEGRVHRVHQEDAAQALGINTDDPDRKFQLWRSETPTPMRRIFPLSGTLTGTCPLLPLAVSETLHNLSAELATLDHSRYPGVPEAAFNVVEERTRALIGQLP